MACNEGEGRGSTARRFVLPLFILVLLSAFPRESHAQFAADWGGSASLESGWDYDGNEGNPVLEQIGTLWASLDYAKTASLFLQGNFTTNVDRPYLFDIDMARLSFRIPRFPLLDSEIGVELGRFVFTDFSGFLLNHKADGARLALDFSYSSLSFAAAYTGFLLKPNSTIVLSRSDSFEASDDDVTYAPARALGVFLARIPDSVFDQDVVLSCILQQDLRPTSELVTGGSRVNTQYLGLGTEGPITNRLFLHVFGYVGMGTIGNDTIIFSDFEGLGLRFYWEEFFHTRVQFRVLRSSGDKGTFTLYEEKKDHSRAFLPISKQDTGIVFSPRMANITLVDFGYSLKPIDRLQTELRTILFFRTETGAISEGGLDSTDSVDHFLGPEFDLTANFRLYSDCGLSLGIGSFFPASGTKGAFYDDTPRYKATIKFFMTF